jgi:hypothetical protein
MMMAQLQNDQRMLAQINAHHYSGEVVGHITEKNLKDYTTFFYHSHSIWV